MHRILRTIAAFSAALLAGSASAQGALEKKDVHIAVGGKSALYYLPLTITEQLGYFKDEGLNVRISDFPGGTRSLEAVVGGSADVVSGSYEHTINMQSKKISSRPLCSPAPRRKSASPSPASSPRSTSRPRT